MNPLDALSPTMLMQIAYPQSPTPTARALYRGRVRKQVLSCTGCQLHSHQPAGCGPIPFHGPKTPMFTVVGEAPGPEESVKGRPFVGESGKLLRALMGKVDIDPDDDVMWVNSVSCLPGPGDGTFRAPSLAETSSCRDNMLSQIETSYSPFVLLVGAKAFNTFRSDLNVTNHHGRLMVWLDLYCVMGIIHPAAALRGKSHYKKMIEEDLKHWRDVVYGGDDPLRFLERKCIRCDGEVGHWDRDGVAYCGRHWDAYKHNWEKERLRWVETIEQLSLI